MRGNVLMRIAIESLETVEMKQVLIVVLIVAAVVAGVFGALWAKSPPANAMDTYQITGGCCSNSPWGDLVVLPGAEGEARVTVSFPKSAVRVDRDTASFQYEVIPAAASTGTDAGTEGTGLRPVTGARVGDVFEAGLVQIEIVEIHDAVFDRNDAIDLKLTRVQGR